MAPLPDAVERDGLHRRTAEPVDPRGPSGARAGRAVHDRELVDLRVGAASRSAAAPLGPLWRRLLRGGAAAAGAAPAAGAAAAALPCFTLCFTCRHSARVFSSPALHACFAARPAERSSRRSSRRSIPCVWAYAGTTPASATTAAKTPTPLRRLIIGRMLFSFGVAIKQEADANARSRPKVRMRDYSFLLREKCGLRSGNCEAQIPKVAVAAQAFGVGRGSVGSRRLPARSGGARPT